ncbi:hypothetical protein, partial [Mesorhizobium sp. M1342]|uniref:hypothetical protein n=1 Tax=Mesorhizobium sp. M1342 TaxID=2957088 RepID=UPI00333B701A
MTRVLRDERGACLSRYGWPVCITLVVQGFRVSNCGGAVPELRGSLMAKNLCGCAGPSSRPSACVARSSGRNPHVSCWSTHPEHLSGGEANAANQKKKKKKKKKKEKKKKKKKKKKKTKKKKKKKK